MQLMCRLLVVVLSYFVFVMPVLADAVPVLSTDVSKYDQSIEAKNNVFKKKFSNAIDKFEKLNIEVSYNNFEALIEQYETNDYYLLVLGGKTAELGFFDLSELAFSKIKDFDISDTYIRETKKMFYPKQTIKKSDLIVLGEIYSNIKFNDNVVESIKELEAYPRLLREYDYANYIIAFGYFLAKKNNEAKPYINTALKHNPDNLSYRTLKTLVFANEKKGKVSKKILNAILAEKVVIYSSRINTAKEMFNYMVSEKESDKDLYLGKYYLGEGDYAKAIRILQGAIGKDKRNNANVYGLLSRCYYEQGDLEKTLEMVQKCSKIDSSNPDILLSQGDIATKNGDYKSALKYYRQAENKYNKRVVLEKIAMTYTNLSQSKKALEIYDEILKEFNNSYIAYYKKSTLENKNEVNNLKKSISININFADAWIDLARVMIDKGNYSLAKNYLSAANCIDGNNNFRYYYYQNMLNQKEQEKLRTRRSHNDKGTRTIANEI